MLGTPHLEVCKPLNAAGFKVPGFPDTNGGLMGAMAAAGALFLPQARRSSPWLWAHPRVPSRTAWLPAALQVESSPHIYTSAG